MNDHPPSSSHIPPVQTVIHVTWFNCSWVATCNRPLGLSSGSTWIKWQRWQRNRVGIEAWVSWLLIDTFCLYIAVSNLSVSLDISSPNPSGRCLSIWPVQQRGMRQLHSFLPSRFLPVAVWNFISNNISKHGWHHVTPHSPNICKMDFQTFPDYNIL